MKMKREGEGIHVSKAQVWTGEWRSDGWEDVRRCVKYKRTSVCVCFSVRLCVCSSLHGHAHRGVIKYKVTTADPFPVSAPLHGPKHSNKLGVTTPGITKLTHQISHLMNLIVHQPSGFYINLLWSSKLKPGGRSCIKFHESDRGFYAEIQGWNG